MSQKGTVDWSGKVSKPPLFTIFYISYPNRESKAQVDTWHKKHLVESDKHVEIGKANGAFADNEYIRVDQSMHRLCAPTQPGMKSFVFWTKETPDDHTPTWDKVVHVQSLNVICTHSHLVWWRCL